MSGNRDVPQRRLDPSKNRSRGLAGAGSSCVATIERSHTPRARSRITESVFGDGFSVRESTPKRCRSPGGLARLTGASVLRPKDNLTGGCVTSDAQAHPLRLPRIPGSCGYGVGSGGAGSLIQGPMGFVPAELKNFSDESDLRAPSPAPAATTAVPFQRVCGLAC